MIWDMQIIQLHHSAIVYLVQCQYGGQSSTFSIYENKSQKLGYGVFVGYNDRATDKLHHHQLNKIGKEGKHEYSTNALHKKYPNKLLNPSLVSNSTLFHLADNDIPSENSLFCYLQYVIGIRRRSRLLIFTCAVFGNSITYGHQQCSFSCRIVPLFV